LGQNRRSWAKFFARTQQQAPRTIGDASANGQFAVAFYRRADGVHQAVRAR
jgi:hypothetical protein